MCMRSCVIKFGEKLFNIIVILGFLGGLISAIMSGIMVGGKDGWIAGLIQLIISWSCTLIVALIVYALIDIRNILKKQHENYCSK